MVALDLVRSESVPMWASWWLVDGLDGEHLRELAGLSGRDPVDVGDALRRSLAELGVVTPGISDACDEVFTFEAGRCLRHETTEEHLVEVVERVARASGYLKDVYDTPVGQLYGMDDEWEGGWGRTVAELRAEVRNACATQLEDHRA